jgi:hypothetical protein
MKDLSSLNNTICAEDGQGAVTYGIGNNSPLNNHNYTNSSSPNYILINYFSTLGYWHYLFNY